MREALFGGAGRQICIRFPNGEYEDITTGIYSGSASLERILCSSTDLNFGECNSSKFEIQAGDISDITDLKIEVYEIVDGYEGEVSIFSGYITSAKMQSGGYYRKITAYDELYRHADDNVSEWYESMFSSAQKPEYQGAWSATSKYISGTVVMYNGGYYQYLCSDSAQFSITTYDDDGNEINTAYVAADYIVGMNPEEILSDSDVSSYVQQLAVYNPYNYGSVTVKEFRDSLFAYVGIVQGSAVLLNDDIEITRTLDSNEIKFSDCIKAICQMNACFGHMDAHGIFQYIYIGTGSVDYTGNYKETNTSYEEFSVPPIDSVRIYDNAGEASTIYGAGNNCWNISGNFLLYSLPETVLNGVAKTLYDYVSTIAYVPAELTAIFSLLVDMGSTITFSTHTGAVITTYVLQDTMSGVQMISQKIKAAGSKTRSQSTSLSDSLNTLESKTTAIVEEIYAKITADSAQIKTIYGDLANYKVVVADELQAVTAKIQNLDVSVLEARVATIEEAYITKADIGDLYAAVGQIDVLSGELSSYKTSIAEQLIAIDASITNLTTKDAEIENALIGYARITDLEAVSTRTQFLEADVADITTLVNGNLTSANIQSLTLTSLNTVIENGLIKNAMIDSVSADKITAGTIYTNNVRIYGDENKNLSIVDNTIQISDGTVVRVQIGEDAAGDYNLYLWDAAGNLMWNATGVTEAGLNDGIIKDVAVAGDANISGSKLNIPSVVENINGCQTKISSMAINVDQAGQTLDVYLNTIEKTIEDNLDVAKLYADGQLSTAQAYALAQANAALASAKVYAESQAGTALASAKTYADAAVDGIEVGGRNLWLNSTFDSEFSGYSYASNTLNGGTAEIVSGYSGHNGVKLSRSGYTGTTRCWVAGTGTALPQKEYSAGDTFTLSAWVYVEETLTQASGQRDSAVMVRGTSGDKPQITIPLSIPVGVWTYLKQTYTFTAAGEFSNPYVLLGANGAMTVSCIKLEKGNTATDWTPAPEDTEAEITNITEITTAQSTQITTMQGQIAALITEDTTIKGDYNALVSRYNATVATVDSLSTIIGEHTTLLDTQGEEILAVQTQANTIESDLTSTKQTIASISDTLDSTVSNVTTITSDLNGITARVSAAETTLKAKADSSTVSTLTSRVATCETTLTGFEATLTATNKTVSDNYTALDNKIDGIEIGARNILAKSGNTVTTTAYRIADYSVADGQEVVLGNKYTVVFKCKIPSGNTIGFYIGSTALSEKRDFAGTGQAEIYTAQITAVRPSTSTSWNQKVYFYHQNGTSMNNNNGDEATMYWACLYEGHIKPPMDWQPAPEDFYAEIDATNATVATHTETLTTHETRITAAEDAISLKVSTTEFNSYKTTVSSTYATQSALAATDSNVAAAASAAAAAQTTANTANTRATYHYGTCATAAATAAKVVTLSGFALYTGAMISVRFQYGNTATTMSLNVNGTGAKNVVVDGATSLGTKLSWSTTYVTASFVYDGTYWRFLAVDNFITQSQGYTDAQITTVNSHLTTIDSIIDVLQAQISLKVTQTDIDEAIAGIEVGGRNLVADSAEISVTRTNATNSYLAEKVPFFKNTDYGFEQIQQGGQFTLSFDYEITGITTACSMSVALKYTSNSYSAMGKTIALSAGDNTGHFEHTFTPTSAQMQYGVSWLLSGFGAGSNAGAVITLKKIKLEKGTKATDWTPAPEDVDSAIAAVDNKFASYSTTTQMTAAITAAKDSITQAVSETYATKTALTTVTGNVTSLTSRMTAAESKLTKDSLVTTIGSYYATQTYVDNLEIGGRNLIPNTRDMAGYTKSSNVTKAEDAEGITVGTFAATTTLAWNRIDSSPIPFSVVRGRTVTLSLWVRSDDYAELNADTSHGLNLTLALCTGTSTTRSLYKSISKYTTALLDEWQKITFTATLSDAYFTSGTGTIDDNTRFYVQVYNYSLYSMQVKKIKLEYGDKATDWTPSPDDDLAYIAEVETIATQTATQMSWLVKSGTSSTNFTLTDRTATLIANAINLSGLVTFSGLDSAAQSLITTAQSTADTAVTNAATAQTTANTANTRATYHYGTCATAAATVAKVVTLSGFALYTGATVSVKFTYANTAASPTLNVNSTGAKAIYVYGAALGSSSPYNWVAGSTVQFTYNGSQWVMTDTSALRAVGNWCYSNNLSYINGGSIYAGTVAASQIAAGAVTTDKLAAGAVTAAKINVADLSALNATIGGWKITDSAIYTLSSVTAGTASTQVQLALQNSSVYDDVFYFRARSYDGSSYGDWDYKFRFTSDGKVEMYHVDVQGLSAASVEITDTMLFVDYQNGWFSGVGVGSNNRLVLNGDGESQLGLGVLSYGEFTNTGEVISQNTNAFRAAKGNYGFFIRNDGSSTYFMLTASGNAYGSYNSLRPLAINDATGVVTVNGTQVTSDERDKSIVGVPDERHESLFMSLEPILYRWADGTTDTRIKIGLGAQTTEQKITAAGLTADEFGIVCHDYFPETPLADGRTDRYSLDYQAISMLMVPVLQKTVTRVGECEARLAAAVSRVDDCGFRLSGVESECRIHSARLDSHELQLQQAFEKIAALEQENAALKKQLAEMVA